jgi:hypothetical protein
LVPRLTTAYIIAVNDAFDLSDRVNVNEAIAADYLVDVPPSYASGEIFTMDDLHDSVQRSVEPPRAPACCVMRDRTDV